MMVLDPLPDPQVRGDVYDNSYIITGPDGVRMDPA